MSLTCWKALGSPELVPSNTLLTAFDGRSFCPHGILPAFEIKLAGKAVSIEVEVIDAPLDYNLLLEGVGLMLCLLLHRPFFV